MKVLEILNERAFQGFKDFDHIMQYIINNCRPALQQMSIPLYRGMYGYEDENSNKRYDKITSDCGRWERHEEIGSSNYVKFFNQYMVDKFGYPYLSKGLFTTGSKAHSAEYAEGGDVFIVLPIGDFKYVWSPRVGDQIDIAHNVARYESQGNEYSYEQFKNMMDDNEYTDSNIGRAVQTGHEIILQCGKYIHISEGTLKEWNSEYDSLEELWSDLRG